IWWFFVFIISLCACVLSIYEVYKKWERSPVIVNFANRGTPVDNIPFPAVTICPESKIAGEDKFNYSRLLLKKEKKTPLSLQDLHYKNYYHKTHKMTEWSLEDGYTNNGNILPYPRKTSSAAVNKGLNLKLFMPKNDLDYACKSPVQGYKVLLHAPTNIPRLSQEYFRVPLDQSVVAAIQPFMVTTSSAIKKYSPKKRGCYFEDERYLKYFQIYTSENCKLECLTNVTLDKCGCVNFFMPRENNTKICGTANVTCMEEVDSFSVALMAEECDCLPRCAALNYEVVTSQSNINWNQWIRSNKKLAHLNKTHVTSLTIYFQSDDFITSQRNEFYGPTDFLANFGGLLGLFTGFSVLSFMEILYFLSVRIFYNRRLFGKWAGPQT
ncbi:ASC domain containing protein, partial [Asbolus verrucosus]